jgi:rSAM/selenodomain-associated transferase 1
VLPLIVVFAKAPRPGFVKTRLGLDPAAAASLHIRFVSQILRTVSIFQDEAQLELSLDMPCSEWSAYQVARTVQSEGDLGVRLYWTLQRGLRAGHRKVVILGSDSPTLPAEHVRALLKCEADVALGPTRDGGFYGIACRSTSASMFEGVRWSSRDALRDTVRAIDRCGLTVSFGPEWFDVDTPEDLRLLDSGAGS